MRVLAASTAGAGHFGPMVPFLRGAAAAGHDVLVAAPEAVRTAEFPFATLPDSPPERLGAIFAGLPGLPVEEANSRVVREVFAGANLDATLPELERLVADWRPDLVLRETSELGSYVAAERAGVPHVHVAIGRRTVEQFVISQVADVLADRHGVGASGLLGTRTLTLVPPSLEPQGAPREHYRDPAMVADAAPLPAGLPQDDRPLVYVTFGTVAAGMGLFPAAYRAALETLAELPVRVLMTTGASSDPERLAPLPPNAHVERWLPQAAVLPHVRVVVGHGGFGTTLGALAAGVPMVVVPLFALDQYENAAAVVAARAGVVADDPAAVATPVTELLASPAAHAAAGALAAEIAGLPDAATWSPGEAPG